MLKSGFFKKSGRIAAMMVVATMLFAAFAPGAFALNYNGGGGGSGNKAFNFNGYNFDPDDRDQLIVYFDKQSSTAHIQKEQFSISPSVTIDSISLASGSGCSDTNLTQGTTVTLNFNTNLAQDTLYTVTIKAGTLANNNGLTLGNYNHRSNIAFQFKTPDSNGKYTSEPVFTFLPNITSDVPWEGNVAVIIDRPVTSDISTFKSSLNANFTKNSGSTVYKDSTIDGTSEHQDDECYTSHANIANTTFFFPETANTNNFVVYNLAQSSNTYELIVPDFDYEGIDAQHSHYTQRTSGYDYTFTTVSDDIAGWLDNTPTTDNATSTTIDVHWSTSGITPNTNISYDVYYSTSQFTDFGKLNIDPISGSSPYTFVAGDTGDNSEVELSPDTLYYFRVVPINTGGEAGFSLAGSGTTL